MIKVALCIPINPQYIASNFLINFMNRIGEIDPKKIDLTINFTCAFPVEKARNQVALQALSKNPDYLWWIDTDMVVPRGALQKLIDDDKDIVSGLHFEKAIPYLPIIRKYKDGAWFKIVEDIEFNKLMKVDGVGFGCILIKADVFKKMQKPYFFVEYSEDKMTIISGEDLYFCKKATELGYEIYVDTGLICGHQGALATEREYLNYKSLR